LRAGILGWEEDRASFEAVVFADTAEVFEGGRARGRRVTPEDAGDYATSDA
jgi:hypothetical protein